MRKSIVTYLAFFGLLSAGFACLAQVPSSHGGLGTPAVSGGCTFATIDFTAGSLPGGVTLTRASAANYYNSSGVLTSASTNAARFDYNPTSLVIRGLYVEPAMTNVLLQSNTFSNSTSWGASGSPVGVSVPGTGGFADQTGPDNTTSAWSVKETAANSAHIVYQNNTVSNATSYRLMLYVKGGLTRTAVYFASADGVDIGSYYDISSTGALGSATNSPTSAAIQQISNGFFRLTFVYTTGSTSPFPLFGPSNTTSGAARPSYLGVAADGIIVYGAEMKQGAGPFDSYIATTTGSASRSADVVTFTQPAGCGHNTYTFDDATTQTVSQASGSATVPTNLNRPWVAKIDGGV